MIVTYAVIFREFTRIVAASRGLSNVDHASVALVRVHLDVDTFRENVVILASDHDTKLFSMEAAEFRQSFLRDVEDAQQALARAPEIAREDASIAAALETLRVAIPAQLDTAVQLADAEDWMAVRLRLGQQIQDLIDLGSSVVSRVDRAAQQHRLEAIRNADRAQQRVFEVVPLAGLLTILVAVALGWYATQSITVPLGQLARGAEALARGDFRHKINVPGSDELAVLGKAFNHASQKLRDFYEELREQASLLSLTHDAIYVRDMSGVIRYWNRGAETLYGWPAEYAVGKISREFLNTAFPLPAEQIEAELVRSGHWEGELLKTKKDGTRIQVATRWSVKRDDHGVPIAILVTSNDITERKLAEQALRQSEAYLAESQRLSHTGSWAFDLASHKYVYVSEETNRILGLDPQAGPASADEILQRIHPDDQNSWKANLAESLRQRVDTSDEYRIVLPDGTVRHIHTIRHPVLNEAGNIVRLIGTSIDITERKRAEEALRRIEAYLAEAQKLTHTGSYAYDGRTNTFPYWSEEHFRIWGFDPQQAPPDGETLLQRVHPEDREVVRELSVKALRERADYIAEYRIVLPDGTIKYIEAIGHPVSRERGGPILVIGTHVDVTERKRAEQEREKLRELEADLRHLNRVSMMGELAASIAHEVNQPLAGVVSNASACLRWLAQDAPDMEEVGEAVRDIVRDGKRAGEVIARIRALTRRAVGPRERLDLNETIQEVLALIDDEAEKNSVVVRTQFTDHLPPVAGDRVQLQQVVLNLVMNAIEAMKSIGDRVRELVIITADMGADHVQVTVEDSGIGLDPNAIEKVFDSFYTTKPGGMGMGLSISRSILHAHAGRLWAVSKNGLGTTFHFTVPKYHKEGVHAGATGT
jgi:PAS domain S-box-containing protein